MKAKPNPNPELIDDDSPEWTDTDFARAVPFSGLPATLQRKLRGPGRKPAKVALTVRYDADVIDAFRATGPRWQARINAALKDWLRTHRA